jgi:crotonobetainyl-CoA:carnitine CoA-transferase CaiB-like acyl-CoA transferase
MLNAGKRSVALDLKSEAERARLIPLLKRADVLVEQFRPGVMARLGLDYDAVRAINPGIVYCSISGYGQAGARAGEAGHDLNYIGATGLLALSPGPLDAPTVPPALIADIAGGSMPAVINILLALRQRDATGQGCHLDIAMANAMFTFAWHALAQIDAPLPGPGASLLCGGSPRYQLYPTCDGKLVACAALEQKFWAAFTAAIGLSSDFADGAADPAATKQAIARLIRAQPAAHWKPIFAAADCCVTIVANLEEALADEHFVRRGLFAQTLEGMDGQVLRALPLPLTPAVRDATRKRVAVLGADNDALLAPETGD